MKQFSLLEIISTVVLLAIVFVDLLESSMLLTQLGLKNVLRARCTLWEGVPLGHYVGYQQSTVQGNCTKECIIAPKWVQIVFLIIRTTLATKLPTLHPFHLSGFFQLGAN